MRVVEGGLGPPQSPRGRAPRRPQAPDELDVEVMTSTRVTKWNRAASALRRTISRRPCGRRTWWCGLA